MIPLNNCASDNEEIDLRLTLAPPGHHQEQPSVDEHIEVEKDQSNLQAHPKRKKRTRAEMEVRVSVYL